MQYNALTYGDLLEMAEKYGFDRKTQIVIQEPFTESMYEFCIPIFSHLDGIIYLTLPEGSPTVPFFSPQRAFDSDLDGDF